MKFVISHVQSNWKRRLLLITTFPFFFCWGLVYAAAAFYNFQHELVTTGYKQWKAKTNED